MKKNATPLLSVIKASMVATVIAIMGTTASVHAQTAKPSATPIPVPTPPFIQKVPNLTQWEIDYAQTGTPKVNQDNSTKKGAKEEKPPILKKRVVYKGNGKVLEITTTEGGNTSQTWYLQKGGVLHSSNNGGWIVGGPITPSFDTTAYNSQDFSGLEWLSTNNYKGEVNYNGKKCFVFSDNVVTAESNEVENKKSQIERSVDTITVDESGTPTIQYGVIPKFNINDFKSEVYAYIDEESRLPIAIIHKVPGGFIYRTYQYQRINEMPPIPTEVEKNLETFKKRERGLNVPHAPI